MNKRTDTGPGWITCLLRFPLVLPQHLRVMRTGSTSGRSLRTSPGQGNLTPSMTGLTTGKPTCMHVTTIMFHTSKGKIYNLLYRRGIKKALLVTEKKEEKEEEVDLLFAEDEEDEDVLKEENTENFTPVCTPTKNRKNLLGLQFTFLFPSICNPCSSL